MYCEDCDTEKTGATFWPLTEEFWDKNNMQRCRACKARKNAAHIRERRRTDPEFLARQLEASKNNRRAKNAIYNQRYRNRRRGTRDVARPHDHPRPRSVREVPAGQTGSAPAAD
jgi:hypothetical protein